MSEPIQIDPETLSRDRGFVIVVADIPGQGTQFLLTTDPMDASKRIFKAGGKLVDSTTKFEEILNEQYNGTAVLGTPDL